MRSLRTELSAIWKRLTGASKNPHGDFGGPGVDGRESDVEVDEAAVNARKPGSVGRIAQDDEGDDRPSGAEVRRES